MARLTPSEIEVARMAVRGQSNETIAHERRTTARTVANQLSLVYQKLGISGRRELVAFFVPDLATPCDARSRRQRQVANLVRRGLSNKAIAAELGIALSSVGTYMMRARRNGLFSVVTAADSSRPA